MATLAKPQPRSRTSSTSSSVVSSILRFPSNRSSSRPNSRPQSRSASKSRSKSRSRSGSPNCQMEATREDAPEGEVPSLPNFPPTVEPGELPPPYSQRRVNGPVPTPFPSLANSIDSHVETDDDVKTPTLGSMRKMKKVNSTVGSGAAIAEAEENGREISKRRPSTALGVASADAETYPSAASTSKRSLSLDTRESMDSEIRANFANEKTPLLVGPSGTVRKQASMGFLSKLGAGLGLVGGETGDEESQNPQQQEEYEFMKKIKSIRSSGRAMTDQEKLEYVEYLKRKDQFIVEHVKELGIW